MSSQVTTLNGPGAPRAAPVEAGSLIAGKYMVERLLGAGGIGVVVAARHVQLDRMVAIKFLLPELVYNREVVARFSREARAAAKLRSEHVASVLDVGELPDGAPYMVMEYLRGCDLATLLDRQGPLPVEDAVNYVLQAGEAIAEAHAAGIVHRDLKPANLFLTERVDGSPIVKVLDFGISKSAAALESIVALSLTSSTAVIGTPLYMSPEQMQSARGVDGRADLWSLGAILYELIAGTPPFLAQTLPQLCIAVMQQEPTSLHRVRTDVPEGLSAIVSRCLAKERSNRYSSVSELANDLTRYTDTNAEQTLRRIQGVSKGGRALLSDEPIQLGASPLTPTSFRQESSGQAGAAPAGARHTPLATVPTVDSSASSADSSSAHSSSLLPRVAVGVSACFALAIGASLYFWQRGHDQTVPPPLPRPVEAHGGPKTPPAATQLQLAPIPAETAGVSNGEARIDEGSDTDSGVPNSLSSAGPRPASAGRSAIRPRRVPAAGSPSASAMPSASQPAAAASAQAPPNDDLMSDRE